VIVGNVHRSYTRQPIQTLDQNVASSCCLSLSVLKIPCRMFDRSLPRAPPGACSTCAVEWSSQAQPVFVRQSRVR